MGVGKQRRENSPMSDKGSLKRRGGDETSGLWNDIYSSQYVSNGYFHVLWVDCTYVGYRMLFTSSRLLGCYMAHERKMAKARLKNEQVFFVPLTLPGLNDIILARSQSKTFKRKGKTVRVDNYQKLKKEYESLIISAIQLAKLKPIKRAYFIFTWIEQNRKRDKDNISAGKKFILDSLVSAKILPNDGWANVVGWHESFEINARKPGVRVQIFKDGE